MTEHSFSAVPLSRVIGPRKRPVLAAPPPQVQQKRIDLITATLPEMHKDLRDLKKRLEALESLASVT